MKKKGQVRIGISNVMLPGNKKSFPKEFQLTSRLHYYSSIFNTVEINRSFYKTPLFSTFEKWADDVPEDFWFSVKLSKVITHAKDLTVDLASVKSFIDAAIAVGRKKGCLLLQFPGKITLDYFEKVEMILDEIQQRDKHQQWRKAVEFRNESWYTGETHELLEEYNASMVVHDFSKAKNSTISKRVDFIYLRFHGPAGNYRDSYTNEFLREKAFQIEEWRRKGKDVYAYFNNTMGNAFENAISLKKMLNN